MNKRFLITAVCRKAPMGHAGLEGYSEQTAYVAIKSEKGYYLFPDYPAPYNEFCGPQVFKEHFYEEDQMHPDLALLQNYPAWAVIFEFLAGNHTTLKRYSS